MSRLNNSIRNIKFAIIGQMAGILISFFNRMVFIQILNVEYLGIDGLFCNILSVLSLAELGVGSAINYSMYKPLADHNEKKISALMILYKKVYTVIGITILFIGVSITPFLQYLVKSLPDIPNIRLIYIMFVINSAVSYFFTYKRSLIIADQKRYIATLYRYGFYFLLNITQIVALIITRKFLIYLGLQILNTLLENISISRKADRLYPFIKANKNEKLNMEERSKIVRNIKAMVCHKIGSVIVSGTDNLLISKLVGVAAVGLYSNYYLIVHALNTIYSLMFESLTASIGNLVAIDSMDKSKNVFNIINFAGFWIYGFSSICLFNLLNPFIMIWLGNVYLFELPTVFIIVFNFYITGMRNSTLIFHDAFGLYWFDRFKPIFEALINIITSIILGINFDITGIFIGTAISTLTTCFWVEPYILYKYGFKKTVIPYFIQYTIYTFAVTIAGVITYILCNMIAFVGIKEFIVKLIICIVIPNIVFLFFFIRDENFKMLIGVFVERFKKKGTIPLNQNI